LRAYCVALVVATWIVVAANAAAQQRLPGPPPPAPPPTPNTDAPAAAAPRAPAVPPADAAGKQPIAALRILDKMTSRVQSAEIAIDEPARFGTLQLRARQCLRRPTTAPPAESAVFIEIDDVEREGSAPRRIYAGWLLASSPGLAGPEHKRYDVWIIECRAARTPSSSVR
jgi:hypothetical protein